MTTMGHIFLLIAVIILVFAMLVTSVIFGIIWEIYNIIQIFYYIDSDKKVHWIIPAIMIGVGSVLLFIMYL